MFFVLIGIVIIAAVFAPKLWVRHVMKRYSVAERRRQVIATPSDHHRKVGAERHRDKQSLS